MGRDVTHIVEQIRRFEPVQEDWSALDRLLQELFRTDEASLGVRAILGIFERFPAHDGFGVFWSAVHGLESLSGYELALIESVRQAPAMFSLRMIRRILNSGVSEVAGVRLLELVREVVRRDDVSRDVRDAAQDILDDFVV
ncbi:MAG: hypothetical protein U0871_22275 [Gemmataceae bacterium]